MSASKALCGKRLCRFEASDCLASDDGTNIVRFETVTFFAGMLPLQWAINSLDNESSAGTATAFWDAITLSACAAVVTATKQIVANNV
ncbi:hypothetical protein ACVIIV_003211 [Bradyrhizobium sp. USDA 4354]